MLIKIHFCSLCHDLGPLTIWWGCNPGVTINLVRKKRGLFIFQPLLRVLERIILEQAEVIFALNWLYTWTLCSVTPDLGFINRSWTKDHVTTTSVTPGSVQVTSSYTRSSFLTTHCLCSPKTEVQWTHTDQNNLVKNI